MTGVHVPDEVKVEIVGAIAVVTLNRPEKFNACNQEMHDGLVELWPQLAHDRELRCVVITGSGSAFCAGADLNWLALQHSDPGKAPYRVAAANELIERMLRFPLPVVAAVNGPAMGLGCSLTLFSDIVLMAESAYIADPHVSVGLATGDGGAYWPLMMSPHHAKEFLFLGRRLKAAEAVAAGLANHVVAGDELMARAMELAERLAAQPPQALRDTKRAINAYISATAAPAAELALLAERAGMGSSEHAERLAAILPDFTSGGAS